MTLVRVIGVLALGAFASVPLEAEVRAQTTPTCSFEALLHTASITVNGQVANLSRTAAGVIRLNGVACGAATVSTTDTILISGGPFQNRVTMSGDFGPGATIETGDGQVSEIEEVSEIEIVMSNIQNVTLVLGAGDDVLISTGSGIDVGGDGDVDISGGVIRTVKGGAGDDFIDFSHHPNAVTIDGQAGDDHVIGGNSSDNLGGQEGNDILDGRGGNDRIDGGLGDDVELGGDGLDTFLQGPAANGADQLNGENGADRVDYGMRTNPLNITLDADGADGADDGEDGEGDDLIGIRDVVAGSGDDTIVGNQELNILYGGAGDDVLYGGDNHDEMHGGPGDDFIQGDAGRNDMRGEDGNDKLVGNQTGREQFAGGNGDDTITGLLDGLAELVNCGPGNDRLELNDEDEFIDCEGP